METMGRVSTADIQGFKARGETFATITAYDAAMARLFDAAGIPLILVGDSLGNTMLGYSSTVPVTVDDMVRHTAAVVRATSRALVVGDMPFLSYATLDLAVATAGRLMGEAGAQAVKLEGGRSMAPIIQRLVECGVPVMGHLGYTPQSQHVLGGPRVQARKSGPARRLLEDALALEAAGCFAIVLELIPAPLAGAVTRRLQIPTIGIGAGPECDGQIQVMHDVLGLIPSFVPRHARPFASLAETITAAIGGYMAEVRSRSFPGPEHSSKMDAAELQAAVQE